MGQISGFSRVLWYENLVYQTGWKGSNYDSMKITKLMVRTIALHPGECQ